MTKKYFDLITINAISLLLILGIVFIPSLPVRVILGLPFILFIPGYVFVSAIFIKADSLSLFERLALSFGFSIVVSALLGLALNYTQWGITLGSTVGALVVFTALASVVIYYRRSREHNGFLPRLPHIKGSPFLLLAMLVAIGSLAFTIEFPKSGEKFTEFYVLGLDRKADSYPRELAAGEQGMVIMGIINRGHTSVSYCIEVRIDGKLTNTVKPIFLANNEKWEQEVSFSPRKAGLDQKVEFALYKEGEPYRELHLWINVN